MGRVEGRTLLAGDTTCSKAPWQVSDRQVKVTAWLQNLKVEPGPQDQSQQVGLVQILVGLLLGTLTWASECAISWSHFLVKGSSPHLERFICSSAGSR